MYMMVSPMMQLQAQVVEDDIKGFWVDNTTKDTYEVSKDANAVFSGKIIELKDPYYPPGSVVAVLDSLNPVDSLKERKAKGIIFLQDCKFVSGGAEKWKSNSYYYYKDGKTYNYEMKFQDRKKDTLNIINSAGERTTYWTKKPPPPPE